MRRFSEDGLWWWDGAQWVATNAIVLPAFPRTKFERSGQVVPADRNRTYLELATIALYVLMLTVAGLPLLLLLLVPYYLFEARVFRAYRTWTLEQLALATSHLLGSDEPILWGEPSLYLGYFDIRPTRNLAVAVTAHHVLLFQFDTIDGPPRRVALAARSGDIQMVRGRVIFPNSTVCILAPGRRWNITGLSLVFKPDRLLAAWRQGAQEPVGAAG